MIGVAIPCFKLDDYLEAVMKQFEEWNRIALVEKDFKFHDQVEVRNDVISTLKDCDFVFTIDADEFLLKEDQHKIVKTMKEGDYDAGFCPVIDYTRDLKHRYKRDGEHMPVVIIDPKEVSFYETRCVNYKKPVYFRDIYLHHLGFTFDDDKLGWKKRNYWNTGNRQEVEEIMQKETEPCELPEEIMEVLNANF